MDITMNSAILASNSQPNPNQNIVMLDEEKNRMIEKVYSSEVFQDFIRQWGNAMPNDEKEKQDFSLARNDI